MVATLALRDGPSALLRVRENFRRRSKSSEWESSRLRQRFVESAGGGGAVLGAGISLLKVLADPYNQLPAITFWLLGSLSSVTLGDVAATLPMLLLGLVPLVLLRWRMNLMSLGDAEARALGVETRVLRPVLIAGATLITAAAVAMTGVIGWIGLIVPHVARLLVGPDYRRLLPASLVLGAGYLVLVDLIARNLGTVEVPLGILTALVGAPFFLWLLASGRRGFS